MTGEFRSVLDPVQVFEAQQLRIEKLLEENRQLKTALELRNKFLEVVQ